MGLHMRIIRPTVFPRSDPFLKLTSRIIPLYNSNFPHYIWKCTTHNVLTHEKRARIESKTHKSMVILIKPTPSWFCMEHSLILYWTWWPYSYSTHLPYASFHGIHIQSLLPYLCTKIMWGYYEISYMICILQVVNVLLKIDWYLYSTISPYNFYSDLAHHIIPTTKTNNNFMYICWNFKYEVSLCNT